MSEREQVPTGVALYYPYIHPRDINCIKAALLYWDRVRRIVPRALHSLGYVADDTEEARILAERDLLVATAPWNYEERAAERFLSYLRPRSGAFQIDRRAAHAMARGRRGIHIEKIGHAVLRELVDRGVAHRLGNWVAMDEQLGAFYMYCLASEMARQMGVPLLSDSRSEANVGQSMLFDPGSADDVSCVLVRIGVLLPSPAALQSVSASEVGAFVERHAGERLRFREAIEGVVSAARTITDENALADYLAEQRVGIDEAVRDHRSALRELKLGGVDTVAKITVPSGLAALAGQVVSPTVAQIAAAVGLAISAVSCFVETRGKLRKARTSSPYHYLVSIDKRFGVTPGPR